MWLRVFPLPAQEKRWSPHELKEIMLKNSGDILPICGASGYSIFRAEDGTGFYAGGDKANPISTIPASMVFSTGEIWSIDTSLLCYKSDRLFYEEIKRILTSGLSRYVNFLKLIGVLGPFLWEAGIVGTKKRMLGFPPPPGKMWFHDTGPVCAGDQIVANGEFDEKKESFENLLPFFENLFEKCGREFPDYLK